jgi:hypothetical protein
MNYSDGGDGGMGNWSEGYGNMSLDFDDNSSLLMNSEDQQLEN